MRFRPTLSGLLTAALLLSCTSDGGVANVLVVTSVDVTPGITDVILGATRQLTATPRTSSGIAVPGRAVAWSTTDALVASVSNTGLVTGVALGGPVRIRATVDGVVGDALITVRPVPIDRITVTPENSPILVGGSVQLTPNAFDAANNPLSGRSFDWESSNPTIAAVTSTGIVIGLGQGGPVTISALAEGKVGTATVSVSTRPATRLAFVQQPPPAVAGVAITPPIQIALQDDLLTTVPGAGNSVSIALAGNPAGATLGGTTTVNGVNGIATFGNLTVNRTGTGYTFLVTSPGLISATSIPFAVAAGAPAQLAFITAPPASGQSGIPLSPQPVVRLLDAVGNPVAQGGVAIAASLTQGAGALGGSTAAVTNSSGIATFTDLSILGAAGSYTISFAAGGLTPLAAAPVSLGSGLATALAMATQPAATAQSGLPLSQQPAVQLRDGAGNNVAQGGVVVTASIASGSGTLGGSTSATTGSNGVATFTSLAINGPAGSYTLGFAAPGLAGTTSSAILLGAGNATQVAITTPPSAVAVSGAAFAQQPVVQLRDGSNNPVAVAGVPVTAAIATGSGTLVGTETVNTDAGGNAVFTNLGISGLVGSYTVMFGAPGTNPAVSNQIVLSAGPATQLTFSQQPSISAASGVAFAQQPVLQLRDAAGNEVSQVLAVTATITGAPPGVALIGTATINTSGSGLATFAGLGLTGTTGNYTLTFTAGASTSPASNTIALSAGGASQLTYSQQPSASASSGQAFAQQPILVLRDASNNPISGVVVTATITGSPAGVSRIGTVTATTNASGIASFVGSGLGLSGPVGNYSLTFTAGSVSSSASNAIALSAGTATQLTYTQQPSATASSGQALAQQPILLLRDAANNPVSGVVVTATITGSPAGVSRIGTVTATTSATGLASFAGSGLGLLGTAGNYTLTFTAGAVTSAASATIALGAGTPTQLTYVTQPSAIATSGVAFAQQPVLLLRDVSNNPVAGVVVTATITGAPAGVSRIGTFTATTNASGQASFSGSGLGLSGPTGNYTLTFTAGAVSSAASNPIALSAGAGTQLSYNTQPSGSASSGQAFGQQPALLLRDASNNPVPSAVVTATITGSPAGVTFVGTTNATTNGSGVATFSGLGLSGPVGSYTLTFTSGAATSSASNTIVLSAGTPAQLTIDTQPSSSATSGVALAIQPVLRLRDAANNPVSGVVVTATITGSPAGVSFVGTTTATTSASGLATFSNLGLSGPSGNYTLTFTAASLTSPATNTITIGAGSGTQLTYNQQPSTTASSGAAFGQQPALLLRDASNNPVAGAVVTATITGSPAGVTFVGTPTATTNGSGIATFTGLGLSGPVGNYTLTFTSGAATSVASNTIALAAGAANTLAANSATSQSAAVSTAVSAPPSVKVTDASGNPKSGVAVTFTVTAGGGTINPASPAIINSDGNGVATLTSWTLGGSPGSSNNTVSATAAVPNGSPVTFAASGTAGSATTIAANSATAQSATVATTVAAPPSVLVTDAGGNPVAGVPVTFTITGGGGSSSPASPAIINTGADGVATLTSWTLGTGAGTNNNTVTATAAVPNGSPVTFTATGVAAAANTIAANSATSQSAAVGTGVGIPPSVLVTDAHGNPKSGVAVTFTVTAGGGTTNPASPAVINTDGTGVATLTSWTLGNVAGTNTVTATAAVPNGSPVTFNATGTAAAAHAIAANSVTAQSAAVATTVAAPPSVKVTDINGNGVAGVAVAFVITGGGGSSSPASPAAVNTDANGVATLTSWTVGTTAGTNTITASASVSTGSPVTFTATGTAGAANTIAANSATNQSATVGTAVAAPPSVLVTDAFGNPKQGVAVTFTVTGGGGSIDPASPAVIATDVNGIATLTNWTLGGVAGSNNNSVTATASVPNGSPVTFTASAVAGPANTIAAASAVTQSGTIGSTVAEPPSVLVTDAGGNPKPGIAVTFTVTAGGGTIEPASPAVINTDANGRATLTSWTLGTTVGTGNNTVTATATVPNGSPVTFTASAVAGPANTIASASATTQSATVGATVAEPPSALVTDAGGNPKAGVAVTFTVTGGGGSISPASPAVINTDGNGLATLASWTLGTAAGTGNNTVTATAAVPNGSPVTFTASAVAGPANTIAANSAVSQNAPAGSAVGAPPSVLVTDANGNPKPGVAVTFTVTAGGGTTDPVSPAVINTDANGVATLTSWTLGASTGTDNNTVTATAAVPNGSPVTFIASGTAGSPSQLVYNQQPAGAVNDVAFTTQPVLLVQDAGNNPVTGVEVTATITGAPAGVVFIGTTTATSDGSGLATFTGLGLRGLVGNYTLTFTSGALSSAASDPISLTVGAPAIIAANSATSQTAANSSTVSAPPSVKVTDTGTNPVPGVAVTFAVTAGGGTVVPADPATVSTGIDGVATATSWTLGPTIGTNNNSVTATATGLSGSPVTFTASATVGPPSQLSFFTEPGSAATNDVVLSPQPVVLVRDAGNNNVAGALVTVSVTGNPDVLLGDKTATAAANGRATFTDLELVGLAGNYTLTFTTSAGTLDSDPIALSPGAAAIITANSVTTQSAEVGTSVAAPPSVKVTDTGLNPIAGVQVTFAVTGGGGAVVPAGPTTVATLADGSATATSWTLGNTAGTNNNTLTATATGLTGSPVGFSASGTAGTATQLTYDTQPSGTATSGVAFTQQPALLLRDVHDNPVEGQAVTATITGSPADVSLIGNVTLVTNASGQVVFSGLGLTGPAGTYTLTFTALGGTVSSPASVDIVLSP